jgi:hypothetical protein
LLDILYPRRRCYLFLDDEWVGRSSEKFPRTSGWRSVERGAEHLGLGWAVKGDAVVSENCRNEGNAAYSASPHGRCHSPSPPVVWNQEAQERGNLPSGVALVDRSKTDDKVDFYLGVYAILGAGGKEKACSVKANRLRLCSALFRRAAHWSHFSIQHFRGLRLQYS